MPPEDFGAKVERDVAELRKKFGMPPLPPKEIREYMPGGSRAGGAAGAAGATGATGARGATGTTGRTAAPRGRKMSQREQKIDERLRNLAQAELTNEQWGNVLTSLAYRGRPDLARKLMMYASEAQAPEEAGDLFSLLGGGGGGGRGGLMQAAMWNPMFQQFSPFNFGQMAGGMGGGGGQNFWNLPYGEQVRAFNRPYQMANFTGFGDWAGFNEANKLLAARRAGNAAKDRQFRELLATWR
jgi:hypothetical protein